MTNTNQLQTVDGVVCPKCFKPLTAPYIVDNDTDRYGRHLRTYFGWCFDCKLGSEVIQFERDGHWLIHKYQHYGLIAENKVCKPTGKWFTLYELPEAPLVVTGPGGDYDNLHEFQRTTLCGIIEALDGLKSVLINLLNTSK